MGDITVFRTVRDVDAGEELCITYIESFLLAEPPDIRSGVLNRDFRCCCPHCCSQGVPGTSPQMSPASVLDKRPQRVDCRIKAMLQILPPLRRVEAAQAIIGGELPSFRADEAEQGADWSLLLVEGESGEMTPTKRRRVEGPCSTATAPFKLRLKEEQELLVIAAQALMQHGKASHATGSTSVTMEAYQRAAAMWLKALHGLDKLPSKDECEVSFSIAAAACTAAAEADSGSAASSSTLIQQAVAAHRLHFGEGAALPKAAAADSAMDPAEEKGVRWLSMRFQKEIEAYELPDEIKAQVIRRIAPPTVQ